MAGDYSAGPDDDDDGFTKVTERKKKRVTFPDDSVACIDEVMDDWDDEGGKGGSDSPIAFIDQVIASHAPEHMKDASIKTKSKHVEEEVSHIKRRLEELRAMSQRTRDHAGGDRPERAPSPVVIDLITPENKTGSLEAPENQAGSPEVPLL